MRTRWTLVVAGWRPARSPSPPIAADKRRPTDKLRPLARRDRPSADLSPAAAAAAAAGPRPRAASSTTSTNADRLVAAGAGARSAGAAAVAVAAGDGVARRARRPTKRPRSPIAARRSWPASRRPNRRPHLSSESR